MLGEPLDPVPPDAAPYVVVAAVDAGGPDDDFGPFYTSERRGGVERRQLKLKGVEGGD